MNNATRLIACAVLVSATSHARETGIWYSTWYTNKEPHVWARGHGAGSTNQYLTDVNGDGFDDAVVYYEGSWNVSLSSGRQFNYAGQWIAGHGIGSYDQLMGDVTGTSSGVSRSDAVVFFRQTGEWYVAAATASGTFNYLGRWATNTGTNSDHQFLANVDGDPEGRADAVAYSKTTGVWTVAKSTGSSFNGGTYACIPASPTSDPTDEFLGDVNGDGKSDAVLYLRNSGTWQVALSNGSCFGPYQTWLTLFGGGATWFAHANSTTRLLAQFNNSDKRADAIAFVGTGSNAGEWWVAAASTGMFNLPTGASAAKHGFTGSRHGTPFSGQTGGAADRIFLGKPLGPNTANNTPVTFSKADGVWRHLNWNAHFTPDEQNSWESMNIKYRPLLADASYGPYDSSDLAQIDLHLNMCSDASIDFLVFDLTNDNFASNLYVTQRALSVAARINQRRAICQDCITPATPRFAVAIGRAQFTSAANAATAIEAEALEVWNQFYLPSLTWGGQGYFKVNDKPLLVVHATLDKKSAWQTFRSQLPVGQITATDFFSIRWSQGPTNQQDNALNDIPETDRGQYYGWVNPAGTQLPNTASAEVEAAIVTPGYNNRRDGEAELLFHSRNQGNWYWYENWERIQKRSKKPKIVMIASFNEYLEESAIWPAETNEVPQSSAHSESWQSKFQYWSATCLWNRAYYKEMTTTPCPSSSP